MYEHTPANKAILEQKCGGTFEAVLTGKGDTKCLIPQVGTLHFLFRGQGEDIFLVRLRFIVVIRQM